MENLIKIIKSLPFFWRKEQRKEEKHHLEKRKEKMKRII